MRVTRGLSSAFLTACLVLPVGSHVFAGGAEKTTPKTRKKTHNAPTPAVPTGVARTPQAVDAYYGGSKNDTITEHVNELGQTVYSIVASHFDVSPPLRELAAVAGPDQAAETEAPTNPQLPEWRLIRSDVPDPVVQAAIQPVDSLAPAAFSPAPPTTGFNFEGVPHNAGSPSDCNGSVGNNQFVETVNTRYQVWSLDRATNVATSILGPTLTNALWAGFGGACESQNSGDPIVIFDKTAKRWLISQFTSSPSGGVYYQCVAVSKTADAIGTDQYYRWAFAVPSGKFGDYPHIGAWSDAYYMMAHGFGGTFVALFSAMDRNKMIAGNAAATWQVIQDPTEGGHMPADLDGFALPPTKAPGIFVSLHDTGMYIYRMKVNFTTPSGTVKTLQAIVPVAPSTAACGGGTCIPQPGTGNLLDAISDRLMFRAAYRNYIDHESLVVSHSVDPSVSGVASGVRWYDFRISGTPNATCPTYPCIYQQGTIADVANGRSRWMPSIAMDTAENILVGYSTSGKTAGSENHSIRYTGRAKGDTPGLMTVPETTIVTGTNNNTGNSRWGDYSSMSVDPADDCTFWYASQYYVAPSNTWTTRIASAVFPAGSGAGQCPPTTCTVRPSTQPLLGTATVPGDHQITITWTGIASTPGAYVIERAVGVCGSEGLYRPLAATAGTATSFTDNTVVGGVSYAYKVRAATDVLGKCQAILASGGCVSATATGACNLKPSFAGASGAASSQQNNCGLTINWSSGVSGCPLTPNLRYNIFRGTVPDFVPSVGNRIATCVTGPNPYLDTANLQSGTTYYYVVRAEDVSTGNGGECGDGNEESNSVVVSGTAYGVGTQAAPGTWTDGGGDGNALLLQNVAGPGNTSEKSWRFVKTADDPGANHTPGGAYAYRNAGPTAGATYGPNTCAELQAPPLTVGATTVNLQYWERHQVEYHWDALAVEYSVNGGAWTDVPAPSNSANVGCAASDDTTGWEPLSCTGIPAGNTCGFPDTKNVFSGPKASGTDCSNFATSATVSPYAHRCHQVTGLTPGDEIQFRWRFSSDPGAEYAGFYLDDIGATNMRLPNACAPETCAGQEDGTACADGDACTLTDICGGGTCHGGSALVCNDSNGCTDDGCNQASGCVYTNTAVACDDGNACTDGDVCGLGVCAGAPVAAPPEAQNFRVQADKTTYIWDPMPNGPRYDVVRGELGSLPVGPAAGDENCFDDLIGAVLVDATLPPSGTGFWYLSRAESVCANGTYGVQSNGSQRITATCP